MPLFFVFTALFLSLGSVLSPTVAKADNRVSPDIFLGEYAIKKEVYGLCDPELQVLKSDSLSNVASVEIDMGRYDFLGVNQPRTTYDNKLANGWYESFTTPDSKLIYNGHDYTKANGEYTDDKTVATLSSDRKNLHIVYHSFSNLGGDKYTTITECVYSRKTPPPPQF